MRSAPVSHAESALIAELARTRIGTQAVAARVGRSRKTVWRHRGIKPRAGALSPMARIELVRLADAGIDYGILAARFGLASRRSVSVIVFRERRRLEAAGIARPVWNRVETIAAPAPAPAISDNEPASRATTITLAGGYVFRDRTLLRAIDAAGGRKAAIPSP